MPIVPFAPWAPDIAPTDTNAARIARNVFAGASSYQPMPSLTNLSSFVMPARAVGLTVARATDGNWSIWGGTGTKLYKYSGGSGWVDATRTVGGNYAVNSAEFWSFAQFGDNLIAVQANDVPQTIAVTAGTNFAALGGSPPQARNVAVVGDFVVLSSLLSDATKVQWSGINAITTWTSGTNLSDFQTFADGGRVSGVAGGEIGYVLQEYAIRRMRFLPGSDYVFTFERVVDGKGCLSPYGFTTIGGVVYFIAEDGFYSYSAQGLNPIGDNRVNRWFLDNSDTQRLNQVYCVADPFRARIYWAAYATTGSTVFDLLMVYDWNLDKWTYGQISADIWARVATPATTLDDITSNIDTYPFSLDSRALEGGRPTLGAVDTTHRLAVMEGVNLAATIETQEAHLAPGKRAFVTGVYPVTDATTASVRVGTRENGQRAVTYGTSSALETYGTGWCSVRSSGRMHRVELTIPSGTTWTHAQGIDFEATPDGAR